LTCFFRVLFTYYFFRHRPGYSGAFFTALAAFLFGLQTSAELRHSLQKAVISESDPQFCGKLPKIHTGHGVSAVE
jgi:hypothetical protein